MEILKHKKVERTLSSELPQIQKPALTITKASILSIDHLSLFLLYCYLFSIYLCILINVCQGFKANSKHHYFHTKTSVYVLTENNTKFLHVNMPLIYLTNLTIITQCYLMLFDILPVFRYFQLIQRFFFGVAYMFKFRIQTWLTHQIGELCLLNLFYDTAFLHFFLSFIIDGLENQALRNVLFSAYGWLFLPNVI